MPSQLVGRRTQLKNEIRAVLPAHLIDPAPARHGHIIKRGRSYTRAMLVEAAWGAAQAPGPLRAFLLHLRDRRGQQIAVLETARKLAVIVWYVLTRDEPFA